MKPHGLLITLALALLPALAALAQTNA